MPIEKPSLLINFPSMIPPPLNTRARGGPEQRIKKRRPMDSKNASPVAGIPLFDLKSMAMYTMAAKRNGGAENAESSGGEWRWTKMLSKVSSERIRTKHHNTHRRGTQHTAHSKQKKERQRSAHRKFASRREARRRQPQSAEYTQAAPRGPPGSRPRWWQSKKTGCRRAGAGAATLNAACRTPRPTRTPSPWRSGSRA
jgi:hypothetical protein